MLTQRGVALAFVVTIVHALTGREKCDACLTVMDEQQILWEAYAKGDPLAQRKARFKLTAEMDDKIVGMCAAERYKRYSASIGEGCRQLTTNVKMKVVKPFLQAHPPRSRLLCPRHHLTVCLAGWGGPEAADEPKVAGVPPVVLLQQDNQHSVLRLQQPL